MTSEQAHGGNDIVTKVNALLEEKEEELLAKALATTIKRYNADPSSKHLRDMEAAKQAMKEMQKRKPPTDKREKELEERFKKAAAAVKQKATKANIDAERAAYNALEDYRTRRAAAEDPENRRFKTLLGKDGVLEYLDAEGWSVGKTKLNDDKALLKRESDGNYTKQTVDKYAKVNLARKDGSDLVGEQNREFNDLKLRKEKAAAELNEKRLAVLNRKLISLTEVKQKHTAKLAHLKALVENMIYGPLPLELIELVKGDMNKLPEMQDLLWKGFEGHLADYAKVPRFTVPKLKMLEAEEYLINDE